MEDLRKAFVIIIIFCGEPSVHTQVPAILLFHFRQRCILSYVISLFPAPRLP